MTQLSAPNVFVSDNYSLTPNSSTITVIWDNVTFATDYEIYVNGSLVYANSNLVWTSDPHLDSEWGTTISIQVIAYDHFSNGCWVPYEPNSTTVPFTYGSSIFFHTVQPGDITNAATWGNQSLSSSSIVFIDHECTIGSGGNFTCAQMTVETGSLAMSGNATIIGNVVLNGYDLVKMTVVDTPTIDGNFTSNGPTLAFSGDLLTITGDVVFTGTYVEVADKSGHMAIDARTGSNVSIGGNLTAVLGGFGVIMDGSLSVGGAIGGEGVAAYWPDLDGVLTLTGTNVQIYGPHPIVGVAKILLPNRCSFGVGVLPTVSQVKTDTYYGYAPGRAITSYTTNSFTVAGNVSIESEFPAGSLVYVGGTNPGNGNIPDGVYTVTDASHDNGYITISVSETVPTGSNLGFIRGTNLVGTMS
jgi:hypothetical protein